MSEVWKRWEGQVIDHKYRLESLIDSTGHSVVFRAEYLSPEARKATVKFLAADIPNADQLIGAWNTAAHLNHPNLQGILQAGRCSLGDMELLYVALEYADENLAEIIPHRALTAEEAREALNAIVDVLVYLHGKGLTHGHICPANILAIGEFLKVSSDTIEPLAEKREMTRERSEYDAPEIPAARYTQAADVWSLGVTVVEMLTQQRAVLPFNESVDPVIPQSVREPFLEIARHALRRKPERRWTSAQIAERLNPSTIAVRAAAAGASASPAVAAPSAAQSPITGSAVAAPQSASVAQVVSVTSTRVPMAASPHVEPLSVPLSKERAVPLAKQPRPPAVGFTPMSEPGANHGKRETWVLPSYALPLFLFVFILISGIMVVKILRNRTEANPAATSKGVKTAPPAEINKPPAARAEVAAAGSTAPREESRVAPSTAASTTATPAPAVLRSTESAPAVKPRNSSDAQGRGEVLDQVLPPVSSKALSTITGTVRVLVKARVDESGQVVGAEVRDAGPSKYFADKSSEAARHWVFTPPEVNGRSVSSNWLIRFEYTHDGVKAFPQQVEQ